MRKIEDYRQHAPECRLMAARANLAHEKQMLEHMAQTWESLSNSHEDHIARQRRLSALESSALFPSAREQNELHRPCREQQW